MRFAAALALFAIIASGCATPADASRPPDIVYGRDLCVECGMLITEPRFASGYWHGTDARRFDDIGDMLRYGIRTAELDVSSTSAWVHDYETEEWIRADRAWYVLAPGLVTPMGWSLVAIETDTRAAALASERDGEVLAWTELFEFSYEQGKLVDDHDHDTSAP